MEKFTATEMIALYANYERKYGKKAYKYISELFKEAKELHKIVFLKKKPNGDHGQSWRSFKGKGFEKLLAHIIAKEIEALGLVLINGKKLELKRLSKTLQKVKENLTLDYGEFGKHLPDLDIVIYNPKNAKVLVVISSKVTLRERIAQSAYWKLKFANNPTTKHIKIYFVTPDEDKTLTNKQGAKKGRAIVEVDLDGSYVMTKEPLVESNKVKLFEHFIEDLKQLIQ